ncbi:ATP-dependent DNA helicase PIF1-like protein [Tanacetum coccineum]|uniref:ATP-dependent DNA helicase PIF1-like protein n=1 Tax=Tanacetum coccineum TaxID=301880 RepID=A0ABQ5APA6_9ASTR
MADERPKKTSFITVAGGNLLVQRSCHLALGPTRMRLLWWSKDTALLELDLGKTLVVANIGSRSLKMLVAVCVIGTTNIEVKIISGGKVGDVCSIPRMNISPSDKKMPFQLNRRQFLISVCFAMTINKSQGQTLSNVGLYLERPMFSHGQLYVAISRVKSKKGLKVLCCDKDVFLHILFITMCPSNKRKSSVNKWERENLTATPAKKQYLERNASKIAKSTTCNNKVWRKWKKNVVEFDPKKRNSDLRRQIAKDRKKDRAYIPPLCFFFEDNSLEDDEEDLDCLDYDELHLAFDREKSPKFNF